MGMMSLEYLYALVRNDFLSFTAKAFQSVAPGQVLVRDLGVEAIAYVLGLAASGKIKRLIINAPPRSLKSIMASVALPAYILGRDPRQRIICASYSNDLAAKHSNDFRALVNSPWYRRAFSATRIGAKDSESEIETTARGFRFATSVGGTLTGRGGNILIIDDPLKAQDATSEVKRTGANEWFNHTFLSRLDNKAEGVIIIVMQRVHIDDLTGFVLAQGGGDWEVLNLPAIAPEEQHVPISDKIVRIRQEGDVLSPLRDPRDRLDAMREALGTDLFSAQYQQEPVPAGGAMIKRAWVKRYTTPPDRSRGRIVQSWDTASKGGPSNDWSVCTTWLKVEALWYLLDVWRARIDYPTLKAKVEELQKTWRAGRVLIEEAGTAIALLQELQMRVPGLVGRKPDRDKESRMAAASSRFQAGQVVLPERADWLSDLEAELFAFPGSRHDDQIDSISQALNDDDDTVAEFMNAFGPNSRFRPWPRRIIPMI